MHRKVVFIIDDGKARMVEVETGISDDTFVEIRSGLSGGEKVVIGPFRAVSRTLEAGDEVDAGKEGEKTPPFVASRD